MLVIVHEVPTIKAVALVVIKKVRFRDEKLLAGAAMKTVIMVIHILNHMKIILINMMKKMIMLMKN